MIRDMRFREARLTIQNDGAEPSNSGRPGISATQRRGKAYLHHKVTRPALRTSRKTLSQNITLKNKVKRRGEGRGGVGRGGKGRRGEKKREGERGEGRGGGKKGRGGKERKGEGRGGKERGGGESIGTF